MLTFNVFVCIRQVDAAVFAFERMVTPIKSEPMSTGATRGETMDNLSLLAIEMEKLIIANKTKEK